jgi:hypothetical protein
MRVRRWLLGSLISVVVLVGASLLLTQTHWFRQWARGLVVTQLTHYIDGDVSIGALEGNVFNTVRLRDVVIARGDHELVRIGQIDATYHPASLLYHSVAVSSLAVTDLRVAATQKDDGWDLASLLKPQPKPAQPSRPWPVSIRNISLTRGSALLTRTQGEPLHVAVDLTGSALLGADGVHTSIESMRASETTTGVAIDSGTLALATTEDSLDVEGQMAMFAATVDARAHLDTSTRQGQGFITLRDVNLEHLPASFGAPAFASQVGADIDLTVSGDDWTAEARFADSRLASAEIAPGTVATVSSHSDALTYTVNGRVAQLNAREFADVLGLGDVPETRIAASIAARGTGADREHLALTADARLGASTIGTAQLTAGTTVGADVRGESVAYRAAGGVRRLNLAEFAALTGTPSDLPSNLNGDFRARGRLRLPNQGQANRITDTLVMNAELTMAPSTLADTTVTSLTAALNLDGRHASGTVATRFTGLNEQTLRSGADTPLSLNGSVDATFDVRDYSAADITETLSGNIQAALEPSSIKGVAIHSASVDTSIADGLATVRVLKADTTGAKLDASGTLALGTTGASDLTYIVDVVDASQFNTLVGADLTGAGRIKGEWLGTRADAHTTGTVETFSLAYGTTASALTLTGSFDVALPDLDPARLDAGGDAKATFITAAGTDLERAALTYRYRHGQIDVDGTVDQKGRSLALQGSLSTHEGGSELLVRRLALGASGLTWATAPNTAATITITPSTFSVDHLELSSGAQKLVAEGGLARVSGATAPKPLTIHGSTIDIADATKLALSTLPLDGTLDFSAHVTGTVDAPNATAELTVVDGKSGDATFEKLSGDVTLDAPTIALNLVLQQSADASLTAKGTLPSSIVFGPDAGVPLDVHVQSTGINLGLVEGLTAELDKVTGTGTIDVHVAGTPAAPDITGQIAIVEGAFHAVSTGVSYQHLNATVALADQRATIDRLSIQDSDGHTLTATGAADLLSGATGRAFAITATSNEIHVLDNELGNVSVTADLKASEGASGSMVTGSLRLSRGRLELDELLPRFTSNPYATERRLTDEEARAAAEKAAQTAASPSMYDAADIQIRLELPDNLVVRGRDLREAASATNLGDINVTLGGSLQIHKAPGGDPLVTGALQAVRGFYQFQGRRFDVERGSSLRFTGGAPMDAILGISATREISGVTARVSVRGTVDRPSIQISSTPALDEGDVLSLIIFNQPMNELGASEKVTLGQRAGALAAGAIASPIAASVARALNLDLVEITAPEASGQGAGVTLGQQLSDRLYLNFKQQFGRGDVSQLSFEYRLNEAIRIITSVAESSRSSRRSLAGRLTGIDLVYFIVF